MIVILGGGRGERLGGRVKVLLQGTEHRPTRRLTLLDRLRDEFAPLCVPMCVVAPKDLHPVLRPAWLGEMVLDPGRGPYEALLAVASTPSARPWLAAIAGDHPFPSRTLLERLWEAADGAEDAVAVRKNGIFEPLFALYRTSSLLACDSRERSPMGYLKRGRVTTVDELLLTDDERRSLLDVDTPSDADLFFLDEQSAPRVSTGREGFLPRPGRSGRGST